MKKWSVSVVILMTFALLFGCMFVLSALSMYNFRDVIAQQKMQLETFVPANDMATDFERQILNARIFFIYHVTIQKPGALAQGWERFRNAQVKQKQLATFVGEHSELNRLAPSVAQLGGDLDAYAPSLEATLAMVNAGTTSGPAYDAQVKEWASRGAVLVTDAGSVEQLCAATKNSATSSLISGLNAACIRYAIMFAVGAPVILFMVWTIGHRIRHILIGSINELSEASIQIASAATEVADESRAVAQRSSEQAATIDQTAGVSSQINSMASKAAIDAQSAAEVTAHSEQTLVKTNRSLEEMVGAMDRIYAASHKISKIIQVIDSIAFQTNILALNAAVEAARAGEAGMGFAVVADEVRNLAQRCADAARDTTSLIEESIGNSEEGKNKVDQVSSDIRDIASEVSRIKTLVDRINTGSVEQSSAIGSISLSIATLRDATQSNAANAIDGASAAAQLNTQAVCMKDVVAHLRALVGGSGSQAGELRMPDSRKRVLAHAHQN